MKNKKIINSFNSLKSERKEEIYNNIFVNKKTRKSFLIPVFASYVFVAILINNNGVKSDSPQSFRTTSIEKSEDLYKDDCNEENNELNIECEEER